MMPKREFLDYIADIHEASQNITRFIADMTWAQFAQDQKTIYAVVRAFEIIGGSDKKDSAVRTEATHEGPMEENGRYAGQTHS